MKTEGKVAHLVSVIVIYLQAKLMLRTADFPIKTPVTDETVFTTSIKKKINARHADQSNQLSHRDFSCPRAVKYARAVDWLIDMEVCSSHSAEWMIRSQRCVLHSLSIPSAWPRTPAFRVRNRYFSALRFPINKALLHTAICVSSEF